MSKLYKGLREGLEEVLAHTEGKITLHNRNDITIGTIKKEKILSSFLSFDVFEVKDLISIFKD